MEDRRTFLGLAGAGAVAAGLGVGSASAAKDSDGKAGEVAELKAIFLDAFSGPFDYEKILGFLMDDAVIVSHDVPFPLDKAGYTDHLLFLADLWESREVAPEAAEVALHGKTGIVSCYFNERGKPKNAGFRQRPGYMTVTCHKSNEGWRAIGLHTSALRSQIVDASPS